MFRWQTPLATWVAGITVTLARACHDPPPPRPPALHIRVAGSVTRGPPDWSDLPWGARWDRAWPLLGDLLAALPLAQREVVHATDVERWPARRVCDVLGLTEAACERLLSDGRGRLRDHLAAFAGEGPASGHRAAQCAAVANSLHWLRQVAPASLDPQVVAAFRRWRAARWPGLRGLPHRMRGHRLLAR